MMTCPKASPTRVSIFTVTLPMQPSLLGWRYSFYDFGQWCNVGRAGRDIWRGMGRLCAGSMQRVIGQLLRPFPRSVARALGPDASQVPSQPINPSMLSTSLIQDPTVRRQLPVLVCARQPGRFSPSESQISGSPPRSWTRHIKLEGKTHWTAHGRRRQNSAGGRVKDCAGITLA